MARITKTSVITGSWNEFMDRANTYGEDALGDNFMSYVSDDADNPILVHHVAGESVSFMGRRREDQLTVSITYESRPDVKRYVDRLVKLWASRHGVGRRRNLSNAWLITEHLDNGRSLRDLESEWLR